MRRRDEQDERAWLLIKTGKNARRISSREDDTSAQSGRTMKQIAAADGDTAETQHSKSSRSKSEDHSHHDEQGTDPLPNLNGLPASAPRFAEPMKALLQAELPKGRDWLFEVKLDGIRAIGIKNGRPVRIFSRRPRELTRDYPEIVEALRKLPAEKLVVDGEIVALDEKGRSSFQLLQNLKRSSASRPPVLFYLFDLLNLNGHDLESLPLMKRKAALETLLQDSQDPLRFAASLEADPGKIWKQVKRLGLEGLIAKRRDSEYEPGRRSGAWLKIKAQNEQEFVIGGYTSPQGSRKYFGSVLVGYYKGRDLLFAGKVGTGFDSKSLRFLYELFQKHKTSVCPFTSLLTKRGGYSSPAIATAEMKRTVWLKPELVCQVKFLEWTHAGILRQPVFLGLREDKKPQQVIRDVP
jgi:bifunctional non-homologous end joining protein LigD